MRMVDAHIHVDTDDDRVLALCDELNLKVLNISVPLNNEGRWRSVRQAAYRRAASKRPDASAWVTGFDLPRFGDPKYASSCIEQLEADFSAGAVGCKAWKNIGMEEKKPDGSFVQIDDAIFTPIFRWLEEHDKTVLLHMAEPLACWRPIREGKPHAGYYKANPQWHMYNKPEYPAHETIIAARDRLVERHPKLRVVGAHLASLEWDVDEMARRFERYPNFAVDTSARLWDLIEQPTEKVRAFFLKYVDRILHGTDVIVRGDFASATPEQQAGRLKNLRDETEVYLRYYSSAEPVTYQTSTARGLGLPEKVVEQVTKTNARRWYPELG
ncbi:MAG: amidohydrolase family protein [Planctomycetes bacterium]|nr:amidohydrolase family protein [Planctomycetota bacterium]